LDNNNARTQRTTGVAALSDAVNQCVNMTKLNLSHNLLHDVAAGGGGAQLNGKRLRKLQELDLSYNALTKLGGNGNSSSGGGSFPALPALHTLKLQGNHLASLNTLACVRQQCPQLHTVTLQEPDGSGANPLCRGAAYEAKLIAFLPKLRVLDGRNVREARAVDAMQRALDKTLVVLATSEAKSLSKADSTSKYSNAAGSDDAKQSSNNKENSGSSDMAAILAGKRTPDYINTPSLFASLLLA
jgi:hypothetical protein